MSIPVYLYTGPEFGERNDAVNALKASLKKKFGSFDDYSYYANDTSVATVVSMLQSESLFTPATCVVYKSCELIKKKEDIELLSSWIKSVSPSKENKEPRESSLLILVSDETSVDSKLAKIIPKENQKIFWVMFENRRVPWLKDFFFKNGCSIEDDAAELVLEMVENNTESLKTECQRFFMVFPKGKRISSEDVESVLSDTRAETAFTLFAAMVQNSNPKSKRLEDSLSILQKIRLSKESSSVLLLSGLTFCFRKLLSYHELIEEYGHPDDLTLKSNGFTTGTMRSQYLSASKIWTKGQTLAILSLLSEADMNIRSTGNSLEDNYLELLIYSIIIKGGAACQSYVEYDL